MASAPVTRELRSLSDQELRDRHDALVEGRRSAGLDDDPRLYRDELRLRMAEQEVRALERVAFALLVASGVALVIAVLALVLTA